MMAPRSPEHGEPVRRAGCHLVGLGVGKAARCDLSRTPFGHEVFHRALDLFAGQACTSAFVDCAGESARRITAALLGRDGPRARSGDGHGTHRQRHHSHSSSHVVSFQKGERGG